MVLECPIDLTCVLAAPFATVVVALANQATHCADSELIADARTTELIQEFDTCS